MCVCHGPCLVQGKYGEGSALSMGANNLWENGRHGFCKVEERFVGISGTTENNWPMTSISEAEGVGGMRARPPEVTAITSGVWIYLRQSLLCPS